MQLSPLVGLANSVVNMFTGGGSPTTSNSSGPAQVSDSTNFSREVNSNEGGGSGGDFISNLLKGFTDGPQTEAPKPESKPEAKPEAPKGPPLLGKGMAGDNILDLQKTLNSLGANLETDGIFGPKTEEALKKFQKSYGLEQVDGIVGPKTRDAFDNAMHANEFQGLEAPQPEAPAAAPAAAAPAAPEPAPAPAPAPEPVQTMMA